MAQAAHYLEELTVTAKEGKLKGFELVKMVHLDDQQFSIEVRRPAADPSEDFAHCTLARYIDKCHLTPRRFTCTECSQRGRVATSPC